MQLRSASLLQIPSALPNTFPHAISCGCLCKRRFSLATCSNFSVKTAIPGGLLHVRSAIFFRCQVLPLPVRMCVHLLMTNPWFQNSFCKCIAFPHISPPNQSQKKRPTSPTPLIEAFSIWWMCHLVFLRRPI